ncbi:hypothetical protein QUC31_014414 [Theobroma cacao]
MLLLAFVKMGVYPYGKSL